MLCFMIGANQLIAQGCKGYYQNPHIYQNTIAFVAEGDTWKTSIEGRLAWRLITHAEEERHPAIGTHSRKITIRKCL